MIFRNSINKYIETDEPGSGGQFWPIVKHVKVRLPNCDVCSSGAVLVDLPGVRDSNAARDKIARDVSRLQYIKYFIYFCQTVMSAPVALCWWIYLVSGILMLLGTRLLETQVGYNVLIYLKFSLYVCQFVMFTLVGLCWWIYLVSGILMLPGTR